MAQHAGVKSKPRESWCWLARAGALLILLIAPAQAQTVAEVENRVESAFDLVLQSSAGPAELLLRRAMERRARQLGSAIAFQKLEAKPMSFRQGALPDPTAGVIGERPHNDQPVLARLPKPRPEAPIVTGSIAPAHQTQSGSESDFFGRFAGSFSGSGEVKRNARAGPNRVQCTLTGRPSANGVSIGGTCGASIFSREVRADIRFDPASGAYIGTYTGASAGPAKLWGKRRGDAVVFVITWPKPVNGDTKAIMTISNTGNGALAISVRDQTHPGGPETEVTRLALNQL